MEELLYKKYMKETVDENGLLTAVKFDIPDNFNFGFDVVDVLAEKSPNKIALYWVGADHSERKYTFADIKRYSNMTANYFKSIGIKKGDKVLLILKRHYQFWFSIIALHKIGAIVVPATFQLMKKDVAYRCNSASISAIVCTVTGNVSDEVDAAMAESPTVKHKIIVDGEKDGWLSFDKGIEGCSDSFPRPTGAEANKATDIMLMYFSSGTTGYPKIAAHAHTYAIGHIMTATWWHDTDPNGIHFTAADTGWGKAAWGKLYGQWFAETCVFVYNYDKFDAEDILALVAKCKVTTFCAPPTIYRFLIKCDLSKYDLSALKYATTAGEALNPEVFKQFYNATGLVIYEGFGQTETTLSIGTLRGMTPKPASMGKPSPQYEIHLLTSEGKEAKTGEMGEICIRAEEAGKQVGLFLGYYFHDSIDKELTARVWHDGFYHSGDLAWCDEDGYYWFCGRSDDIIKSSGYRIGPFEIESILMEHPSVLECAISGVPDPVRGQLVKATILLAKGYTPSEQLKKEIQDFVKHQTAPYKYPRVIEFVDSLPKTANGKIRRVDLRTVKGE